MDAAKTFLSSDDDRLKYINRQMAIMDYSSAIRGAREDGEARGEHNAIKKVTLKLLKKGPALDTITDYTGFSPEEVHQIEKDNGLAF